jgi:DNA-binding MarR family transcriptional regulator
MDRGEEAFQAESEIFSVDVTASSPGTRQRKRSARMTGESETRRTARLLLSVVTHLHRWAEVRAAQEHGAGLSLRQFTALTLIQHESTTLGVLAQQLHVTPAVVTGLIDRLERRGYVHRSAGADDRRRVVLSLTEEGRQARDGLEARLIDALASHLSSLAPDDLHALERIADHLGAMPLAGEPGVSIERSD